MLFGLSLTKLMVLLSLAVLLFVVPLMSLVVTFLERRRERCRKGDRR